MSGVEGREPATDDPNADAEEAVEGAAEVLQPAIPPAGAAILIEVDPRLNRLSETEEELKELIESNESAEEEAATGNKG